MIGPAKQGGQAVGSSQLDPHFPLLGVDSISYRFQAGGNGRQWAHEGSPVIRRIEWWGALRSNGSGWFDERRATDLAEHRVVLGGVDPAAEHITVVPLQGVAP